MDRHRVFREIAGLFFGLFDWGYNMATKNEQLLDAARNGKAEEVCILIAEGADVNAKNDWGWTALQLAASKGDSETVKLLADNDARIDEKGRYGTALHLAVAGGLVEMFNLLILMGADIHAMNCSGQTPLHLAALEGHTGIVYALIWKGANVNAMDEHGFTALDCALMNEHRQTAAVLITEMIRKERGETAAITGYTVIMDNELGTAPDGRKTFRTHPTDTAVSQGHRVYPNREQKMRTLVG